MATGPRERGGAAARGTRNRRPGTSGESRHEGARHRKPAKRLGDRFREVSDRATTLLGTPWAMLVALAAIVGWAVTGPLFHFSDTWQLVINTATTIITFLMVFVIQTSQNRTAKATQFKLDELIQAMPGARNRMIAAEEQSEAEERRNEAQFQRAARRRDAVPASPGARDQPRTSRRRPGGPGRSSDAKRA